MAKKILIVDDNVSWRNGMKEIAQQLGYTPTAVDFVDVRPYLDRQFDIALISGDKEHNRDSDWRDVYNSLVNVSERIVFSSDAGRVIAAQNEGYYAFKRDLRLVHHIDKVLTETGK